MKSLESQELLLTFFAKIRGYSRDFVSYFPYTIYRAVKGNAYFAAWLTNKILPASTSLACKHGRGSPHLS
jgi:hypothetical protein